ncbi:MAG: hypothetical protein D6731_20585 [Planctomycetota bacterium]|nr:MAG: hypothetical protein D6731_20585 [Planctomycetota bacterium]
MTRLLRRPRRPRGLALCLWVLTVGGCGSPPAPPAESEPPKRDEPIIEEPPRAPPFGAPRPKLPPDAVTDEAELKAEDE